MLTADSRQKYQQLEDHDDPQTKSEDTTSASLKTPSTTAVTAITVRPPTTATRKLTAKQAKSEELTVEDVKDVIIESPFAKLNANKQYTAVAEKFNEGRRGFMELDAWPGRGQRINSGKYLLAQCNSIPQLVPYTGKRTALPLWPVAGRDVSVLGVYDQTKKYYGFGDRHVINVPVGQFAKVTIGNKPYLFCAGVHVIQSTGVEFDPATDFVSRQAPLIQHGDIVILNVPSGEIAAIRIGSEHHFIRSGTHIFLTESFELFAKDAKHNFYSQTERLIHNGSKTWVLPPNGTVGIADNGGHAEIIRPKDNGEPTIKDTPTFKMTQNDFLPTGRLRIDLPTINNASKEIAYTTADGANFKTKLLVIFSIHDPELAIRNLTTIQNIYDHLESRAIADMGFVAQSCQLSELITTTQGSLTQQKKSESSASAPTAPPRDKTPQEEAKDKLAEELKEVGITIYQLNFEQPKVLNEAIAKQLAQSATHNSEMKARQAALGLELEVQRSEAQRAATIAQINQDRENTIRQSKARAELQAAQTFADAKIKTAEGDAHARLIAAKAEADAKRIAAEGDAAAITLRADAERKAEQQRSEMLGTLFKAHPVLADLRRAEISANALRNANVIVGVSADQLGNVIAGTPLLPNQFRLFSGSIPQLAQHQSTPTPAADAKITPAPGQH